MFTTATEQEIKTHLDIIREEFGVNCLCTDYIFSDKFLTILQTLRPSLYTDGLAVSKSDPYTRKA